MIITVTLNPAVDKTLIVPNCSLDEVNRVKQAIMDPGGKGINVSKSVQALGGDTMCIAVLGGATGEYIETALAQLGLKCAVVRTPSATRTNIKIVDPILGTNTDLNDIGAPMQPELLDAVWETILAVTKPSDTVVFAGKNPPGTPDDLLAKWTRQLVQKGISVCLDTVGEPMRLAIREKPTLIKPNQEELEQLVGKRFDTEEEILHTARQFTDLGVTLVAVSLGSQGALIVTKQEAFRVRVPEVPVVSTVGAGDAMMAALAYYLQQGLPLEQIARQAAAVSAATVQIEGSKPAHPQQIDPLLDRITVEKR